MRRCRSRSLLDMYQNDPRIGVMSDRVSDDDFSDIHAQVRRFIRHDVVPRENEIMAADRIPDDIRAAAAQMGLFGYAIPAEWGGLGLDLRQDVELAMEFGYTTLALRSMFGTNNGIAGQVLVNFGTDVQKKQWLERIASGEVVASFALTEPGAGSNPAGLRTRARSDGNGWVLDGQKRFITNAPLADLFVVFARTREPGPGGRGIAVFLVAADTPGVSVGQLVQAMLADQYTGVAAGRALVREVPVERIYREVRLLRLYEGTSEIQQLIIGGALYRDQQRAARPGLPA